MFERKPFANVFSVEQVFDVVRVHLPDRFDVVQNSDSVQPIGVAEPANAE